MVARRFGLFCFVLVLVFIIVASTTNNPALYAVAGGMLVLGIVLLVKKPSPSDNGE